MNTLYLDLGMGAAGDMLTAALYELMPDRARALEQLGAEKIIASPVQVGFGKTRCAHGLLPVPAPATAELLLGVPIRAGNIEGELCTPTGAALIRQFVSDFGPMPLMTVERMGYGLGQKDFPAANCLRAMLGES